jgi:hypothetical protein
MKSPVVKRSIVVASHTTSVSLEEALVEVAVLTSPRSGEANRASRRFELKSSRSSLAISKNTEKSKR